MTPKHIREFSIGTQRFVLKDRGDGTLQVSSIHPYDGTEYHWAWQASKSCWHICRYVQGHGWRLVNREVSVEYNADSSEITPEEIAQKLLDADAKANLKPKRAIW